MYVRFFGPTKLHLNKNNWWISVSWVHWQVSDHISLLWNLLSEQCLKQTNCKEKKSVFCVVLIVQLFYRHFKCNLFLNCRLKKTKETRKHCMSCALFWGNINFLKDVLQALKGESWCIPDSHNVKLVYNFTKCYSAHSKKWIKSDFDTTINWGLMGRWKLYFGNNVCRTIISIKICVCWLNIIKSWLT